MKIPAQSFFTFCASHVPLLRSLAEQEGELSETEAWRRIREFAGLHGELPETTWRRLKEFGILVPSEPGGTLYLLANPVGRLLDYLFDDASPATPEMVRGYVDSLDSLGRRLSRAMENDDVTFVGLAFTEINDTLRRIHADLEETQKAVQNEVALFKVNRQKVSVRDRYRRIVYWMERFIEPMVEIVRPDGLMASAFEESERLLKKAHEQSLFNDHPALERNLRQLRLIRQHALRVFQDCRKELQPLYDSLRRSSFIAAGAAAALEKLQKEGLPAWGTGPLPQICQIRIHQVPGDKAIGLATRRITEHPPVEAPVISLEENTEIPPALVRRLWLESLPGEIQPELPVSDLLEWITKKYPAKNTAEVVGGFTTLLFHPPFRATFVSAANRIYETSDGSLTGVPLCLEKQ